MKKWIISKPELKAIENRIRILQGEDATATAELAEATSSGAETWHDNAAFDAAKDKKNIAGLQLAKLESIRKIATVSDGSQAMSAIVGTRVEYQDEESGQKHTICLAGDAAWLMGEDWASVQAPLGQALMDARIGDVVTLSLPGQERTLKILNISNVV